MVWLTRIEDFDAVEMSIDSDTRLAVVGSRFGTLCALDLERGELVHTLDPRREDARTGRHPGHCD